MDAPGKLTWNRQTAAHLLRRAAFGGTPEEVEELADLGLDAAVAKTLAVSTNPVPAPATDPGESARLRALRRDAKASDKTPAARRAVQEFNRERKVEIARLRAWWLERMRAPAGAGIEKLTLFWHGHFATSLAKVRFNHLMRMQNETLRRLGMGSFTELCTAMVVDPAMLVWLDGKESQAKAPNENFPREIMELFTLGEGNYTEDDVREAARCFTGWQIKPETAESYFVRRRFAAGRKTLFGRSGNFGVSEAVSIICAQPRCAEFLATKLWEFYAYPQPEPALVKSLAAYYRANNLHTGKLLERMFGLPEFYADRARAVQIKSPVQWLVQVARETGRQLLPMGLSLPLTAELGQDLFTPPSVKGWDGGVAWINSATLIRRSNTAQLFTLAAAPLPVETAGTMDATAWLKVAPQASRVSAEALTERLAQVFLAAPPAPATRHRLSAVLSGKPFPSEDAVVREASVVLLASPEYNLC